MTLRTVVIVLVSSETAKVGEIPSWIEAVGISDDIEGAKLELVCSTSESEIV